MRAFFFNVIQEQFPNQLSTNLTKHHVLKTRLESFKCNCELLYRVSIGLVALQIKDTINNWIHATVCAGEQVQALLKHNVCLIRCVRIHEEPFKVNQS